MRQLAERGSKLRLELLEGIRKDSTSFGLYMEALAMPKATEEEKMVRREAMQRGLRAATEAPLDIAEAAAGIFPIAIPCMEALSPGCTKEWPDWI